MQKYLFILLFLIFSCDKALGPEDCAGIPGGDALEDECGECGGDGSSCSLTVCEDIDENVYETVQIGDQIWMAENLKTTHYNDGSEIPNITNNDDWNGLSTGAYGDYDNNPTNSETYGRLYNWYTIDDDRGVCPDGWHVPSDEEYTILTDYLGGELVAGGKLKECTEGSCPESEYWYSSNIGATNESGFTGLPAGWRNPSYGIYGYVSNYGAFWSSTEDGSGSAWYRDLGFHYSSVMRAGLDKHFGFSIRCLKD